MEKNKNYLSIKNILIFWVIVIIISWIISGLNLALGLFVAAIISILIMYFTINSSWQGTIEKIKTEKVYDNNPDSNNYKEITYAYVRLLNGKVKKIRPYPDFKVGDKLKKEKGNWSYEKV